MRNAERAKKMQCEEIKYSEMKFLRKRNGVLWNLWGSTQVEINRRVSARNGAKLEEGERPVLGSAHSPVEMEQETQEKTLAGHYAVSLLQTRWDPQELSTILMPGTPSLTTGKIFGTLGTAPSQASLCSALGQCSGIFWVALSDALNARVVLISGCHTCWSASAAIPEVP